MIARKYFQEGRRLAVQSTIRILMIFQLHFRETHETHPSRPTKILLYKRD